MNRFAVFAIVAFTALFACWLCGCTTTFAPSLLQGIADRPYLHREEFRNRVVTGHPIGSDATALEEYLSSQRFQPLISREDDEVTYHYSMMVNAFCSGDWGVTWNADAQGKLVKIDTYAQDACL